MMPPGQDMPPQAAPQGPPGVPPGMQPNPAFEQWMGAYQQQQTIVAENTKRQQAFEAACQLIRDDGVRGFKLDIEADSTIAPDEQAEKAARVEFLQQITPLIQQLAPIAQGNPEMAELTSEIALFAVRGFRVARTLEEAFEKAFKVLGTMAPVPPKGAAGPSAAPPDPGIEQAKIAAQVHDTETRAVMAQRDSQTKAQATQASVAGKAAADQAKAQTDQMALALKAQQMVLDRQTAQEKMAVDVAQARMKDQLDREKIASAERSARSRNAASSAGRMK